ncbi:hypothetical protein GGF37_000314 [Kickxella alabastrina]|nr:hypothetical protein GGF37_000314 [Kickxella alabastrina]
MARLREGATKKAAVPTKSSKTPEVMASAAPSNEPRRSKRNVGKPTEATHTPDDTASPPATPSSAAQRPKLVRQQNNLQHTADSRSRQADPEDPATLARATEPGANFIMSSPKRKLREAGSEQITPVAGSSTRRRKLGDVDPASGETGTPEIPGFHSPLPKRLRPLNSPDSDASATNTPTKAASRWAMRSLDSDASPSPLKSILSPVLDLFRRVSGMAQDPLGLQRQASNSSSVSLEEEDMDMETAISTASEDDNGTGTPTDSAGANSLTAPPMNPTTLGAPASTIPTYLSNGMNGAGIQLYLPESDLDPGSGDISLASGFPETPSKENVPVFDAASHSYDFGATEEPSELSAIPLSDADAQPASDLSMDADLSHMSSLGDSEIDAQYEQYLYDDDEDDFNPYLFMADLPPVPKEHALRPYALPRKTRSSPPITLVLDLDETLVHCVLNKVDNADLTFPVEYNGINYDVYCRLRPGYKEFLEKASELFEVVVFTASQQVYADRLLNIIDPERRYIRHRLFRDSCVYVNTNYVKDLGILGRDESKMVLVDNCPQAFAYQQSNGIPIESWYEDRGDQELMHLMEFLETLVGDDDVRPKVEAQFKTKEKIVEAKKRYQFRMGVPYGSPIWARGTKV